MQRRITTRGLIIRNNQLYAQRLKNRDGTEKDFWCIPGGGLEPNESLHDGLRREMIEETGVTPDIGPLVLIQQYAENDREFIEFFFLVKNVNDFATINLEQTSHGMIEVAEHGFISLQEIDLRPAFLMSVDLSTLDGSPVPVINYLT